MTETLYRTKINYVDLLLTYDLDEDICKEVAKFINSKYDYDEFIINHNEFELVIILITSESKSIFIKIKNIVNKLFEYESNLLTFRYSNLNELRDGFNSIR